VRVRGIDYYELLGVRRDASRQEIRSAYRGLAKAMHPDAGGTAGTFRLLREAYETLSDPSRRAAYDRGDDPDAPYADDGDDDGADDGADDAEEAPAPPSWRTRDRGRFRPPRAEPEHEPTLPVIEPDTVPWWHEVRGRQVVLAPLATPTVPVAAAGAGAGVLLLLILSLVSAPLAVWLVALVGIGGGAVVVGRRLLAAHREDRRFTEEFGTRAVFGAPGTEPDEVAERLTADLLRTYLTRLPGARIFHGLAAEEGSVFADLDHAVLCGHRLVLVESKRWLPGHYDVDQDGCVWRNGNVFRGGAVRLPELLAAYRALLPDVEIRGAVVIYPGRAGEVTSGDGYATTPAGFVREIGGWLAAGASTVDRTAFRTLLRQVVSPG
jgi:DnaJ-like protein/nuclease-like protein